MLEITCRPADLAIDWVQNLDSAWIHAEFDAIVAASYPTKPPSCPPRRPTAPPRRPHRPNPRPADDHTRSKPHDRIPRRPQWRRSRSPP